MRSDKLDTAQMTGGLRESEVVIGINPRQCDSWIGTRAQLEAEGVVPPNLTWPTRTERVSFTSAEGLDASLQRRRPPGSGRSGRWADADYWEVWRGSPGRGVNGGPEIYERERELAAARFRHSARGQFFMDRLFIAYRDASFQGFLARVKG